MKKLFLVCLMAVMGLGICTAQQTAGKKGSTIVVFSSDIDCESCVAKIMNNVTSLGKGVKDVKADVAAKEITVVFDGSKNTVEHIAKGLESLKVKVTPKSIDGKAATCCKGSECTAKKECCAEGHDHGCCKGEKCAEKQNCTEKQGCCKDKKCEAKK